MPLDWYEMNTQRKRPRHKASRLNRVFAIWDPCQNKFSVVDFEAVCMNDF